MEVNSATSKGKRKIGETKGDDRKLKPPPKCLVNLDFEESGLEIWKDAAWRRGGHYQHLEDAPDLLRDLLVWLKSVTDFENATKLRCPDYSTVRAMVGPRWMGRWTPKALLAFQAVANSSGIMHPPRFRLGVSNGRALASRNKTSVPKWRTHGGEACRRFVGLPPRQKVHHVALPPSQNVNRKSPDSAISGATVQVFVAAPTPPSVPPARASPFGRSFRNQLAFAVGADNPRDLSRGDTVLNRPSLSAVVSGAPSVAVSTEGARPRAPRNTGEGHLIRPRPNRVVSGKQVLPSGDTIRLRIARERVPDNVVEISDSGDSEGKLQYSTAAVAGSFISAKSHLEDSLGSEEEAGTSVSTQGSVVRSGAHTGGRYVEYFPGRGAYNKPGM